MRILFQRRLRLVFCGILMGVLVGACLPERGRSGLILPTLAPTEPPTPAPLITAVPTRPSYEPGVLVEYAAQTGDTLPALAAHFNTTEAQIRKANPEIPADATTLPPGLPMKIPIYYLPLWGSQFQILPDFLFVDGPAAVGFDTAAFIQKYPGWLKNYQQFAFEGTRTAAEIIDYIAVHYSVSPRLLLALIEYQAGGLSLAELAPDRQDYPLGYVDYAHKSLYMQLNWAANALNNAYYTWRAGRLPSFDRLDGTLERPDPWQNAATVALQVYFSRLYPPADYLQMTGPDGFIQAYTRLFGDPWAHPQPHIPGSLRQPAMQLPILLADTWIYSGGPHAGWGENDPLAALDFAPPLVVGGCTSTDKFALAVADGVVARAEDAAAVLDLDGDGDERTGWVVFYLHLAANDRVRLGTRLKAGDPVGHPSCEGGRATGTHVHIARKYNGEWILADGPLAFNLDGWVSANGAVPYEGTLRRLDRVVTACTCSNPASEITR